MMWCFEHGEDEDIAEPVRKVSLLLPVTLPFI
jgi:hypothetical protein